MTPNPLTHLKAYCDSIGLQPRTLIEVGAAHPATYRLGEFVAAGHKVVLVEANPRLHYCLTRGFDFGDFQKEWPAIPPHPHHYAGLEAFPNVTVHHAAIVDVAGPVKLYECNASSFVGGTKSPATVNDGYQEQEKDAYEVRGMTIDEIDDGEVDVLLADCEGSEWFCLKHLKSRPKVIILEMAGQRYVNPHADEILQWLKDNGYTFGGNNETDMWAVRKEGVT